MSTRRIVIKTKEVDEEGEVAIRTLVMENTNKLLFIEESDCIGGKTGSNNAGG